MRRTGIASRKLSKPPRRAQEIAQATGYQQARLIIWERAGGHCEMTGCGRVISTDGMNAHHRRLRSAGGTDCPCGLMALCALCHHQRVHAHPANARDHGWIISRFDKRDPSQVGMLLAAGFRFFTCDGLTTGDPTPSMCSIKLHATVEG